MTSEERHKARYLRRREARAAAKAAHLQKADDFEQVFSYGNLYRAYRKCRRGVSWKASVQRYITNAPLQVYQTMLELRNGTYKSPSFFEFDIFERGKRRHIRSTGIKDRTVQRCLCDNALVPVLGHTFIHDNGACMKGKGYDFAVDRLECHLQRHIRKHGTEGYILVCDLSSFFDSIPHREVMRVLRQRFRDERIISLAGHLVRQFDPDTPAEERQGLGLGSQVSQVLAPAVAGRLDHFIKEVLSARNYGRYMDDFYIIASSKEYLQRCKEAIRRQCERLGFRLNEKKTQIVKLTRGFTWLKVRWTVTRTGAVIRRIHHNSVVRARRRVKKMRRMVDEGCRSLEDAQRSFESMFSHMKRFRCWRARQSILALFKELFRKEVSNHAVHQSL